MSGELIDLINIGVVLIIVWLVFTILSLQKNYIKKYKRISLLFFGGAAFLFILYFSYLKQFFVFFTLVPFSLLTIFYCCLFLVYKSMRRHVDFSIVEKLEARRVYFASISYRYIIYKSFDILFQQTAILCILAFLKDLAVPFTALVLLFAASFSINHFFMLKRGSMIGAIFVIASFFGGLIFPILLSLEYGIVYTYILHWVFYIVLGVIAHSYKNSSSNLRLTFL